MQHAKTGHILISEDETHHLIDGVPMYQERYLKVLKFHEPGLAPVITQRGAYHIDIHGKPNYSKRFINVFGFYQHLAAVEDQTGWYHIYPDGTPAYIQRYHWCGNFQNNFCVVKNKEEEYFHIDIHGNCLYLNKYRYAGDFRDGIAVVCRTDGLSTHIDTAGSYLHDYWFDDLDIFHKGFARAKDKSGWTHITKSGLPIYSQRFAQVEPFYNGVARVETHRGGILLINEQGECIGTVRQERWSEGDELSSKLVSFWGAQTIYVAAKLKLFELLPAKISIIAQKINVSANYIERLLRGLWELGLANIEDNVWILTSMGQLFVDEFYTSAAIMWHDVNGIAWENLYQLILEKENSRHPSLKEACANQELLDIYHHALDGYANKDFLKIIENVDWYKHQKIIGCERTGLNLLRILLTKYPHLSALSLGHAKNISCNNTPHKNLTLIPCDITKAWSGKADAVCLPRCLHYWPDKDVVKILSQAKIALDPRGKIYIWEMLLEEDNPSGSLLDLNMLAETGGRLRNLNQWKQLTNSVGLKMTRFEKQLPYLTLLVLET